MVYGYNRSGCIICLTVYEGCKVKGRGLCLVIWRSIVLGTGTWRTIVLGLGEILIWNLEKDRAGDVPNGLPYC